MNLSKEQQAELIKQLDKTQKGQAELIAGLTSSKVEQGRLIANLNLSKEQQAELIKQLDKTQKGQAQLILAVTEDTQKQAKLIEALTADTQKQAKLIEELSQAKQQTAEQISILSEQVTELAAELKKLKSQQAAATDFSDEVEFEFQMIIRNKLNPMTKDYLIHLAKEIKQKIDPKLDLSNYSKLTENIRAIQQWPEDLNSQLLKQKVEAVCELKDILNSKNKPSNKVSQFYEKLNEADKMLADHRDPIWIRFTTNALIVLSIILTGILPGLAVLGAVALAGNSPKFWQSTGQTFFQRANKEIVQPENDLIKDIGIN